MSFLLDTDTLIYLVNGRLPVNERVAAKSAELLMVSTVSMMEVWVGFEKMPGQQGPERRFREFVEAVKLVPFEAGDARAAARVRAVLEKGGQKIGAYDLQIAGQALERELVLVTHNTKHFSRVPGLKVEDWMA
ncbi:MAG: PIN domain-containing protein [Opitutales bacterium]|jgi:tRNA(fMet)-specific endonuclease VapC